VRIIKAIITTLLIITLVLGSGFLLVREALLIMTTSKIKSSINQIKEVQQNQQYTTECASKGSDKDEKGKVHETQLRFLDSSSYVLEAICNQREMTPVEFFQEDLPPFVTVKPGKSGIRWGQELGLNFEVLGRIGSVIVVDEKVVSSSKLSNFSGASGPPSECSSYGYQCCDETMHYGVGDQQLEALDCPQDCFEVCEERPIILSFSTQPTYNQIDRSLQLPVNESKVLFSFVASSNLESSFSALLESDDPVERFIGSIESIFTKNQEEDLIEIELDFGDGKKESFEGLRGQVEHQYKCPSGNCEYKARLKVIKNKEIESYDSPQNLVIVQTN